MIFFSPDNVHINQKNFTSLVKFASSNGNKFIQNDKDVDLISKFGNYDPNDERYSSSIQRYSQYTNEMLADVTYKGTNVFDICRAELLSLLIVDEKFASLGWKWSRNELIDFIIKNYKKELVSNIAVTIFWIDKWKKVISDLKFDTVLVFSGSLIYAKSLMEIAKTTQKRVFVLESYFTGNDFYCEERFEHISNNSLLKFNGFYKNIKMDIDNFDRDYIKAINKIIISKNLNVTQPASDNGRIFDEKYIAIIGQVVNDFSILEYNGLGVNAPLIYKKIIDSLLSETDYCILFKGHPWEHQKANLKTDFTIKFLKEQFKGNQRVKFVDDYNIYDIFKTAKHIVLFNSQAGVEAAWNGIRPIVMGDPFYGNKGFTFDCDVNDLSSLINIVNSDKTKTLGLGEYDDFMEFLIKSMQYHLVSKFPSGSKTLAEIFKLDTPILLAKKNVSSLPAAKASNKPVVIKSLETIPTNKKNKETLHSVNKQQPMENSSSLKRKRLIKLVNNPKAYCLDSKYGFLRLIGRFL